MRARGIKPLTAIAIIYFDGDIHAHIKSCHMCIQLNIWELQLSMFHKPTVCHRHSFCGKLFRRDFTLFVGYVFISGNNNQDK